VRGQHAQVISIPLVVLRLPPVRRWTGTRPAGHGAGVGVAQDRVQPSPPANEVNAFCGL